MGSCLNCERNVTSPRQVNAKLSQKLNVHERCEKKEEMYIKEIEKLEGKLLQRDELIKKKKDQSEKERIRYKTELKRFEDTLSIKEEENRILKEEKEILLTRLSAIASMKLTDGNANIADLSDVNRPTKLAEQYSELYDNEWTDAYDVIHRMETDEKTCRILLDLFCIVYRTCINRANIELQNMKDAIKSFLGEEEPPTEVIKLLKDQRKRYLSGRKRAIKKELADEIKYTLKIKEFRKNKKVKKYLDTSITLCWLMAVQDPPVFIDINITGRDDIIYNSKEMRAYTKSGDYIDFIVWPPLYLHRDGNLLCKGVAQGKDATELQVSDMGSKSSAQKSEKEKEKGNGNIKSIEVTQQQGAQSLLLHDSNMMVEENCHNKKKENQIESLTVNGHENKEQKQEKSKRKRKSITEKLKTMPGEKGEALQQDSKDQNEISETAIVSTVSVEKNSKQENSAKIPTYTIREFSNQSMETNILNTVDVI